MIVTKTFSIEGAKMMKKKLLMVIIGIALLAACTMNSDHTTTEPTESISDEPVYPEENCDKALEESDPHWIPIWCEEFDYVGPPNPAKWVLEHKGDGFGNNEEQYYTPRKENVYVENGVLRITVRKEKYRTRNYTSAKLMSIGKGDFRYGKIEVRAKLPQGRGTWPAIWMMPTESVYGGWPNSGEIDIMEHVGYDPNRIHGTVHTANYNHKLGTQKGKSIVVEDVFNTYHVYAIEWEPDAIRWFVDGIQYFEFKNDETTNPDQSPANWPFDQYFYIILNVAFGGDWGGAHGIDPNFTESSMYVDYVRVYQKNYEALDQTPPDPVTDIHLLDDSPTHTHIVWKKATDDVGVSHYEIYLDDQLVGTTSFRKYIFEDLKPETEYLVKIVAVDFTNKRSKEEILSFTTSHYPSILDRIKATTYFDMWGVFDQDTEDEDGGKNLFGFQPNDYVKYQLYVPETGMYRAKIRVASYDGEQSLQLIDCTDEEERILTTVVFEATGGFQQWETIVTEDLLYLNQGTLILMIKATGGDFSLNWFQFVQIHEETGEDI